MPLAEIAVPATTAAGTSAALLALIGGSGVALGAIISAFATFFGNKSQQAAARSLAEWQVVQNRSDAVNLEGRTAVAVFLADVNEFMTSLTEQTVAYDPILLAKVARSYVHVETLTAPVVRTTAENCYNSVMATARHFDGDARDSQMTRMVVSSAHSNLHRLSTVVREELNIDQLSHVEDA